VAVDVVYIASVGYNFKVSHPGQVFIVDLGKNMLQMMSNCMCALYSGHMSRP
jgi:hypothetical protein